MNTSNRKTLVEIIREAKERGNLPKKPQPIKIPESIKKYDRIYLSQERTREILNMR